MVNSDTVLNRISQDLNNRFVSITVCKDMQAVVVHFGRGQMSLDVVPGFFHKFEKGAPVYAIPDGVGRWIETSPQAHNTFINRENKRSGEKLKKIGQLVRYWKYSRAGAIPISSFYIDLLLAQSDMYRDKVLSRNHVRIFQADGCGVSETP